MCIRDRYQIPKGLIEMELTESIFFTDEEIEAVKEQRCVEETGDCIYGTPTAKNTWILWQVSP